jgi:hypothetical protein
VKIKITLSELYKYLKEEPVDFPKYSAAILNLANYFSQGTRPRMVGQLSDLIQEFPGNTIDEWRQWYQIQHPDAIDRATDRILSMVKKTGGGDGFD